MKFHRNLRISALAVLIGLFTLAAPAVQGQPARKGDPAQRIGRHVQFLDERLNLTDAQAEQIRGMLEANADSMWANRAERRGRRVAQMQQLDEAIEAILTPEQREAYVTLKSGRQGQMKGRRAAFDGRRQGRDGRPGVRFEAMADQLNLTEQQQTQFRQIRDEQREKMRAWMQANPNATREERQAYLQQHFSEVDAAVEAILTPEQMEQYRSLKAEQRARSDQRPGRWFRDRRR